jgi:uncharacterized membrane protein YgcG
MPLLSRPPRRPRRPGRQRPLPRAVARVAALAATLVLAAGSAGAGAAYASAASQPAASQLAAGQPAVGQPAAAWGVSAQDKATRFHVDYVANADGSINVTQSITWQFPSGEERHGIERLVKVRAGYQNQANRYRYYELSAVSAASPTGAPADISITDFGAFKRIRIGNPSKTVQGRQSYVVKFRLANYINAIDNTSAEFYYNLVDPSNNDIYEKVTATLTGPVAATKAACFYGERGATDQCEAKAGTVTTFAAPDAKPGEGASILASFPRSAFGTLEPDVREGDTGTSNESVLSPRTQRLAAGLFLGLGVLLPLLAAGFMGLLVYQRGRDEQYAGLTPGLTPGSGDSGQVVVSGRAPTVAVQFTPPAAVQPGMLGTVIDESADVVDVTGTLIDLAVRGHLTLAEVEGRGLFSRGDWLLTRADAAPAPGTSLAPYEQELLDGVFAAGPAVYLSDLKNTFAPTLARVQSQMYSEVVRRGWFRRSPKAQRSGWVTLGRFLVGAGFVSIWLFGFGGGFSGLFDNNPLPFPPPLALSAGIIVSGFIVTAFGKRMAARTADGSAVLAQSLGFRQYLVTAEANQIKWEEAQDIFSRYLPFAIVFGVADKWAQTFEEVSAAARASGYTIPAPIWYVGAFGDGGFGNLAASMDSFSTTAAGTFVSTPGSSGSSGFSVGGGFSGGGGGGDSGGSW